MGKSEHVIFGLRPVIEAVNSGVKVSKVLVKQGLTGHLASEMLGLLKHHAIPVQYVPVDLFRKYKDRNHQGVVAYVSPVELHNIEELLPAVMERNTHPLILVLDRITDVRNFGAIVRTAECAGVDMIVVPAKGAANIGGDAVKTSAGALHHIPICRVGSFKMLIPFLKQLGVRIVSASEKGERPLYEAKLDGPVAIVMGAEDTGISYELLKQSDEIVKIPLRGKIESLNVSVAAGVLLYEAVRQRLY